MYFVTCTNVHLEVTNLVNCEMVQNAKFWISWERKIAFLQNKRNLNLCLRWYMLRSYRFVAEVTFNGFCFIEITNFSNKFKQFRIARKQKNIQLTWLVIQFKIFCKKLQRKSRSVIQEKVEVSNWNKVGPKSL